MVWVYYKCQHVLSQSQLIAMYSDFLRFYRTLHAAIIAKGSLCVYLKSTIPEKQKKEGCKNYSF